MNADGLPFCVWEKAAPTAASLEERETRIN